MSGRRICSSHCCVAQAQGNTTKTGQRPGDSPRVTQLAKARQTLCVVRLGFLKVLDCQCVSQNEERIGIIPDIPHSLKMLDALLNVPLGIRSLSM